VAATEGSTVCFHSSDAPSRPGWRPITPLTALAESGDDD
jgi:hypothetical protein